MWQKLNLMIEPKIVEGNNLGIEAGNNKAVKLLLRAQLSYTPKKLLVKEILVMQ